MKVVKNNERGAFAIDALIGLTFFMLAVLSIMFMALIVRVQANVQYALGQTAKEISGYYYVVDKLGLSSIHTLDSKSQRKKTQKLNDTMGTIVDFSGDVGVTADKYKDAFSGDLNDFFNKDFSELDVSGDVGTLKAEFNNVSDSIQNLAKDNPIDSFKTVLMVFGRSFVSKGLSYFIAPLLCKTLMPKYMTSGDANEYYKSVGIDPDSVKFTKSQLMMDGRSIRLVVDYTLNTKMLSMGMVDMDMNFRQVAVTAAWVRPNGNSIKSISEVN